MKHQVFRAALITSLLLTQLQLLWMAAFHWNEEPLPTTACIFTVQEDSRQAVPSGQGKNPCVVCQIVRQNAVRPGIGTPMPQPVNRRVYFRPAVPSRGFYSYQPNVANGRAPPLS